MQNLDRSDRTGSEDHFALGARFDHLAVLDKAHAGGAAALDDQAIDMDMRLQPQVRSLQRRLEEAARRRPAPSALLVDMEIADAFIVAGIEVGNFLDAHFLRGLADRIEDFPGQPWGLDTPAAAGAMMRAVAEEVIFKPPEHRQHVVIGPALQPELAPVIVVGGLTAHRDHGVDRRRAADHLASRVGQRAAVEARLALGLEHPVRARIADGEEIADRDVKPDPVVLAAGFEDQHALARIGRQPIGEDTSGGARADDDVVEITFKRARHQIKFRQLGPFF